MNRGFLLFKSILPNIYIYNNHINKQAKQLRIRMLCCPMVSGMHFSSMVIIFFTHHFGKLPTFYIEYYIFYVTEGVWRHPTDLVFTVLNEHIVHGYVKKKEKKKAGRR